MTKGHWFCDDCNDVVHLRGHGRPDDVERCPVCGRMSATFIPDTPAHLRRASRDAARAFFAELRQSIQGGGND
jgi:hypothetical protein